MAARRTIEPVPAFARAPGPRPIAAAWSWWRTIVVVAPICWAFALIVESLSMHALSFASGDLEVVPATTRALAYLLLLPVVMLAARAAVAIGTGRHWRAARLAAQSLLALGLGLLQRPSLAAAAALHGEASQANALVESIAVPTEAALAVWTASGLALAMNYALCVGMVVGVRAYQDLAGERLRRAEVERQATQARLQALTRQLNPHFLFNVLNTVVALIGADPARAQRLVTRTSDLLRRVLSTGDDTLVTLRREAELLEDYLEIQHVRHPDRLSHAIEFQPGAADSLVPALILQPIVENAVLHGLRSPGPRVHVRVDARIENATLEVCVVNPGPAAPDVARRGLGIGLRNVEERLRTLYHERARLDFRGTADGCYETRLSIPQTIHPEAAR
jgi:hypothetical protein